MVGKRKKHGKQANRRTPVKRQRESVREMRRADVALWRNRVAEPLPKSITVAKLFGIYLATLEAAAKDGTGSPSAVCDARSVGHLYVIPAVGTIQVRNLRTPDVIAWVDTLRAIRSPSPLAPKYILKIHAAFRSALEIARTRGVIEANPAARLPPGILPENETRPGFDPALELPSLEEFLGMIGDKSQPLYRRLFWSLLGTGGMRRGEAAALTLADVNLRARPLWSIAITKSHCSKTRLIVPTKTRQHKIAPAHADLLRPLIEAQMAHGFRDSFGRDPAPSDLLVAHPERFTGRPTYYPDNSSLRHWKAALVKRGLDPRRIHALRHFFDSTLDDLGADPIAVQEITHPPKRRRDGIGNYRHISYARRCSAVSTMGGTLK